MADLKAIQLFKQSSYQMTSDGPIWNGVKFSDAFGIFVDFKSEVLHLSDGYYHRIKKKTERG